ncbi:MAG: hypothetical protein RL531_212 [Actinomycetota bacterium]
MDGVTIETAPIDGGPAIARRTVVLVAAGAVAVGVGAALIDPTNGPVLCPFRRTTGLDCPLCGATRAVHAFVTGHPLGALDHNLLVGVLLPVAAVMLVIAIVAVARGRRIRRPVVPRTAWITLAVVAVAFGVVRNLPSLAWLASS